MDTLTHLPRGKRKAKQNASDTPEPPPGPTLSKHQSPPPRAFLGLSRPRISRKTEQMDPQAAKPLTKPR